MIKGILISLLSIPDDVALAAHIGVGHRADPWPAQLARAPVEEFAFLDEWGQPLVEPLGA